VSAAEIDLSLYLVTDAAACARAGRDVVGTALAAADGGITCVQVREKGSAREHLDVVLRLARELPSNVALIVNDRVDVFLAARAAGARVTGVHVGQGDLPAADVRDLIGQDALLGVSARTPEQLTSAAGAGADYVGVGPLHDTATKADAPAGIGLERWAALAGASPLPAVAIGGVTAADGPGLRAAGANGMAVVSAVCASSDPAAAASELRAAWRGGAA